MAIARCFEKNPNRIVNIVVPHNAAKEVWEGVKNRSVNKRIRILMAQTYLSLPKDVRKCDLLLIDEGHRFSNEDTELFGKVIDKTDNTWIMVLSATLEVKHKQFLEGRGIRSFGNINMEEARKCGYVSIHYNYIIKMGLSQIDEDELKKINKQFHNTWKLFGYNLDEIITSMQKGEKGERTRAYYANIVGCSPNQVYGLASNAHKAMRDRKNFFHKAPSKLEVVKQIIGMFPKNNIITFSEFTDVSDTLTMQLGPVARSFHSGLETQIIDTKKYGCARLKKLAMKEFEDPTSEVRILNTARALDEAADIDNVEVAILISYTSKARQTIQRIGRTIRYKEGKIAYIFILCLHSDEFKTQERTWLNEAIKELDDYEWIVPQQLNTLLYDKANTDNIASEVCGSDVTNEII
jgi:superfamily II DNA or RNA helicase